MHTHANSVSDNGFRRDVVAEAVFADDVEVVSSPSIAVTVPLRTSVSPA